MTDQSVASCALNSRIANKAFNLILGRLAEWLKLSHRLSRHLVSIANEIKASCRNLHEINELNLLNFRIEGLLRYVEI